MSYERLNDEESRARVAAIIAAAESLAHDEVRPAKTASGMPVGSVSYRKWALGLGLGACALAGLVIWRQSTRPVTADQTSPPSVLVASDLATTTTAVATTPPTTAAVVDPTATTVVSDTVTTAPVATESTPVATTLPAAVETTAGPVTTAPATTAAPVTTAPPATTAPPTPTTIPVEGPHLVTDAAIESFTALSGPIATATGRVAD